MFVPVIWTEPPAETSRSLVQPVRQITSEISGSSGITSPPPPLVAPLAAVEPKEAGVRQANATAKAASEKVFDLLVFNLFPGACGVSWRARAERDALRSNTCLRFAPGEGFPVGSSAPSPGRKGLGYLTRVSINSRPGPRRASKMNPPTHRTQGWMGRLCRLNLKQSLAQPCSVLQPSDEKTLWL